MLDWLNKRIKQRKVAERMRKHMNAASGPQLHRSAVAMTMTALEDEPVEEVMKRLPIDQQEVFMMVYECFLMWSFINGLSRVVDARELPAVIEAMRNHFAADAWWDEYEFPKLWRETEKWMPEFSKPAKDGSIWPAAALVQILAGAGYRLNSDIVEYTFGCHVLNTMLSLQDTGKFVGEQEISQKVADN